MLEEMRAHWRVSAAALDRAEWIGIETEHFAHIAEVSTGQATAACLTRLRQFYDFLD